MKRLAFIAAAAAFVGVQGASAQGFYADGGYSFVSIDEDNIGASIDLGAINGHVGYDFNANFGVEGELMIGVADEDFAGGSIGLNSAFGAFGKAQLPVAERVRVFARAGVVQAELEVEATGLGSASESETGAGYGVGAVVDVAENIYIRGDYTRYDIEDVEADGFFIGVGMTF